MKKRKKLIFFNFFFSAHQSDQMSEGSQVSKVTLCVEILKWHPPSNRRRRPRSGIELPGQLKTFLKITPKPRGVEGSIDAAEKGFFHISMCHLRDCLISLDQVFNISRICYGQQSFKILLEWNLHKDSVYC